MRSLFSSNTYKLGSATRKLLVATSCLTAIPLFAQMPSGVNTGPLPAPINAPRYGNINFPGGLGTGPRNHITSLSDSIAGRPGFGGGGVFPGRSGGGAGRHGRGGFDRGRTVIVPWAVPVGYYPYGNGYDDQDPNVTVVTPPQQTPSVIINQNFIPQTANPSLRDYSDSDLPETPSRSQVEVHQVPVAPRPEGQSIRQRANVDDSATIYMIALKDDSIRQAIGYWMEGDTLHYLTPSGTINRVSMDQVDRELSEKLNRERNVEFSLRR
ncbi:MAG TPA: hypothetical protein VE621_12030 [Bryobacteraceae bacterium]|nr:hypothetical protein [Bryobacteraceae bacterium]